MNKVIWIIGQMCSGKTHYSKEISKLLGKEVYHLDHINRTVSLEEAYRQAISWGLIEGYTPFRDGGHYNAIMKALEGKEVIYILIEPEYEQWLENCKPIIACPTDENPPNYTKEEYEAENNRLRQFKPKVIIK